MPALVEIPTNVPIVSNRSMKRNVNTATSMSRLKRLSRLNWSITGAGEGGVLKKPFHWVIPRGIPMNVVVRMPSNRAPVTFRISRTAVRNRPMNVSMTCGLVMSPSETSVASLLTIMPDCCSMIRKSTISGKCTDRNLT